jgi:hypothetical protein
MMVDQSISTVSAGIELIVKASELSLVEYMRITQAQAELEAYLGQYIRKFSTSLPGAFARKTMISPLAGSEVEMLVLFSLDARNRFAPSELLDKLQVTLKARYPGTQYKREQNSIVIPMDEFSFRLQPGFTVADQSYLIPSPFYDDWIRYDAPEYHYSFLKTNNRLKGNLTRIIRLIKTWNRATGGILNDYFLELLVWGVLRNTDICDCAEGLVFVFNKARMESAYRREDPTCAGAHIEGLIRLDDVVNAQLHFQSAYHLARDACSLEAAGNIDAAVDNWKKLFPGCYPTEIDLRIDSVKNSGLKGADALRRLLS